MNLIIDIGNTRTKVFVFRGDQLSAEYSFQKLNGTHLKKIIQHHKVTDSILSTVVSGTPAYAGLLKKNTRFFVLNQQTRLPLRNHYKTKETLGNDRIANAAGAAKIFPKKNCLVIDAGTCVKYDFINSRGEYLGGAISPGLMMRYRSMHDYTSKLPLVKPAKNTRLTGSTTKESMVSGVQQGMLHEMSGFFQSYRKKYHDLKVIITGGDAGCFAHLLNFPIFAAPNLTAIGLNEILRHQYPEK